MEDTNKFFFIKIILSCFLIVLVAKFMDFLIGEKRRKWIKDKIIVQPWIVIESLSFFKITKLAAQKFYDVVVFLFGPKTFSLRAFLVSSTISISFVMIIWYIQWPSYVIKQGKLVSMTMVNIWQIFFLTMVFLWNVFLDFISYSITRNLARLIKLSKKLWFSLSFWLIDCVLCFFIIAITFFSIQFFINSIGGNIDSTLIIINRFVVSHGAFSFAFTGAIPTFVHILFFLFILFLVIIEIIRRSLSYLLERFDEENKSPFALLAGFFSLLVSILIIIYKYF